MHRPLPSPRDARLAAAALVGRFVFCIFGAFRVFCVFSAIGALLSAIGCAPESGPSADDTTISVFTTASLGRAMIDIEARFERANLGLDVLVHAASSVQLRRQIELGARADVFVSASSRHMDALEAEDRLAPDTRFDVLRNELVLVTARDESGASPSLDVVPLLDHETLRTALGSTSRLGLGDQGVPVGEYARAALRSLRVWPLVEDRIVPLPNEQALVQATRRGVLDHAVVYRSSLSGTNDGTGLRAVGAFPSRSHAAIVYPAAMLRESAHPEAARRFLDFLRSEPAREIFGQRGFAPVFLPAEGVGR